MWPFNKEKPIIKEPIIYIRYDKASDYYFHTYKCDNCQSNNYRYVKCGVPHSHVETKCDNCGNMITSVFLTILRYG